MLRRFSWKSDYAHYPFVRKRTVLSGFSNRYGFACINYTFALQPTIPSVGGAVTTPSLHRNAGQYWNINQLSIDYPPATIAGLP